MSDRSFSPSRASTWTALSALGMLVISASAPGCSTEDDTQVLPPVVLGMLQTDAPTYDDGQQQIFEVYTPVELPVRAPKQGEAGGGAVPPYPRAPFQLASDTRITVRYTLTNLEDVSHDVELLIDPWNEFVRYLPGVTLGAEDMTQPNFSGIDRFFVLPAKGRIEGILTPDDMVELATDLGTAMNLQSRPTGEDDEFGGPVLYNRAFNVQNRSSQPDPLLSPFVPGVVAGLVGFDLGLRTYEQAKIAVELVIDVEDLNGDRVIKADDDGTPVGQPGTVLSPPAATREE